MKAQLAVCVLVLALFATSTLVRSQDDSYGRSAGQQEEEQISRFFWPIRRNPLRFFCSPLAGFLNRASSLAVSIGSDLTNVTTSQLLVTLLRAVCLGTRTQPPAEDAIQPLGADRFFWFKLPSALDARNAFCRRASRFLLWASGLLNGTNITALSDQQLLITVLNALCGRSFRDLEMGGGVVLG